MNDASGPGYMAWNDALSSRFFNAEHAGLPVYLFVTEDVVEEVGRSIGGNVAGYLSSVRAGPPGATRAGHCQRALQVADHWRDRRLPFPPYLAYLCLFVLAGGLEGEFDSRSYYPQVWKLLGESQEGTPPSFDRMLELWDDLEKWSVRDEDGALGLFEARIIGGKIHIGLPLAQTMLTEDERKALPRVFTDAGLDPASLPTDRELRRALTVHGRSILRARTLHALKQDSGSFADTLLDVVSEDFLDWNGEVPELLAGRGQHREVSAGLRLCLAAIDRVSNRTRATVRSRARSDFPEGGLSLTSPAFEGALTCDEYLPGWSDPLVMSSGEQFVPAESAWSAGLVLTDTEAGWHMKLHKSLVRLFVEGRSEQLPGLIEVLEIPRDEPFYFAYHDMASERLQAWLVEDCVGWDPIQSLQGLPAGWTLGSIRRANSDDGLRAVDDRLGFPDRRSIRFVGGLPGAVRNTFFHFAPPSVVLEGVMPGDALYCNGQRMQASVTGDAKHALPNSLPVDTRIAIEARHEDQPVKGKSLYLVSGVPWQLRHPQVVTDGYGRPLSGDADGIAGAYVPELSRDAMPKDLWRTPGLKSGVPRIYFVGRSPGQISQWPTEPLPDWEPVWAVPFVRRGRAYYCGGCLDAAAPTAHILGDSDAIERWRRLLWRDRKKIAPPSARSLSRLWSQYLETARRV